MMFSGGDQIFIATEGQPRPAPGQEASIPLNSASPGFAKALGVPLLAGRDFTEADTQGSTPVAVINQAMAKRFWPNSNPLGMHVTILSSLWRPDAPKAEKVVEVVGVVGDYVTFDYLYKERHSLLLVPFAQRPEDRTCLVIRSNPPPQVLVPSIRGIMQSLTNQKSTQEFATWEELLARDWDLQRRRFPMTIVWIFASLAMIMTAVGIFGVVSYSVSQRTHEMAIRMSLGAQRKDVVRLVVGEGVRISLVGLAVGLAGTLALGRLLASYIYGVTARDPITFVLVGLVMLGVATLAALIPARWATKVDPMVALRYE
jgi:putative ABC transport system permease protein